MWGTTATLARVVFRDLRVPVLEVVELRLLIAACLLALWLAWRRPAALRVPREDWGYLLVLGVFGVTTVQGSYYYTIASLGVGLAILLQYLAPALIVTWETLRGTPLRPRTAIAVATALAGAALLVGGVDPAAMRARPLDWAIGFSSAFAFAFYVVFSKRGLRRLGPETVLLYTFLIAALTWSFVHPPWRILAAGYGPRHWALFLTLGVGSTLLPFSCFYAGLRRLPPAEAGIVATFEPVIAVFTAALFLGEGLHGQQWGGAALVLVAALLASWPARPDAAAGELRRPEA